MKGNRLSLWKVCVLAFNVAGVLPLCGAVSEPTEIALYPDGENLLWGTVHSNVVEIPIVWPDDSADATLSITDGTGREKIETLPAGTETYGWNIFTSSTPKSEAVYDLKLVFNGTAMTNRARLAVTQGAFGLAEIDTDTEGKTWFIMRENTVIPFDAAWTNFGGTVTASCFSLASERNARSQSSGVSDWFDPGLGASWGTGVFTAMLSFTSVSNLDSWVQSLVRYPSGIFIILK